MCGNTLFALQIARKLCMHKCHVYVLEDCECGGEGLIKVGFFLLRGFAQTSDTQHFL